MGKPYVRPGITLAEIPHRGPVMLYDDFEGTLKWTGTGDGADFQVIKDDTYPFFSSHSLLTTTRNVGHANGDYVQALRTFPLNPSSFIEFSCYFFIHTLANCSNAYFKVLFDNGSDHYTMSVWYHAPLHKWILLDSLGSSFDIPGANITLAESTFHKITFSANIATELWNKVTINNSTYDLSSYPLRKLATSNTVYSHCILNHTCTAAALNLICYDDVLVSEILT